MTDRNAARLGGDDYQHLFSWFLALALKLPDEQIWKVTVEDKYGDKVDDVTVRYKPGATQPDCYYQIKFHVDYRSTYSYSNLISSKKKGKSLLENFWHSWQKLRSSASERGVTLYLVSNWTWDSQDALGRLVSGFNNRIKVGEFMSASPESEIGQIRLAWQQKLQANDEDFKAFIGCLYFQIGYSRTTITNQVLDRMKSLQLKTDAITLKAVTTIVREWIEGEQHQIDLDTLERTLKNRNQDLYLPRKQAPYIAIHMQTIVETEHEGVDYLFDWRDYFVDSDKSDEKGHQLKDPKNWKVLRDELYCAVETLKNGAE